MSAYKEQNRETWYAKFCYRNYLNKKKWVTKRGFTTKEEAEQYEHDFLLHKKVFPDILFEDFVAIYRKERVLDCKENTAETKENIIDTKLLPFFGKMCLQNISVSDVKEWQQTMLEYRDPKTNNPYSGSYLNTLQSQLSAIFNHAVEYYKLPKNPVKLAGQIKCQNETVVKWWTKEQYQKFAEYMMDDPVGYYCFQMIYWCGLREGEVLALTEMDFDISEGTVSITKTYSRTNKKTLISDIRSENGKRIVKMPEGLTEEICEYLKTLYDIDLGDRIFPISKSALLRKIHQGSKVLGLDKISISELRNSHAALLISMGHNPVTIAERMGCKSDEIISRYGHLFPTSLDKIAEELNAQWNNVDSLELQREANLLSVQASNKKNVDRQGRWRSKTVGVRVSPEENAEITTLATLSGMTKQDYIISRLLNRSVVVVGNPRIHKALKNKMEKLCEEFIRICDSSKVDGETLRVFEYVLKIYDNFKR